jgi:MFS family permease
VAAALAAAVVVWRTLDVTAQHEARTEAAERVRVLQVVRAHRRVLLTVGVGVLVVGIARATRVAVVPLWAESVGLSAAQTSLVFGVAGGIEMLLFYPAGSVMDRFGRVWVAVPTVVVLGLGTLVLPLTSTLVGVGAVAVLMGVGNGMGSGIVMTLGADVAPELGRAQFLGAWRLVSLVGLNGGPLLVSLIATLAGLATACATVGGLVVLGGLWLARWVPAYDPRREAQRDPSAS